MVETLITSAVATPEPDVQLGFGSLPPKDQLANVAGAISDADQTPDRVYTYTHGDGQEYSGSLEQARKLCPALARMSIESAQATLEQGDLAARLAAKGREKRLAETAETTSNSQQDKTIPSANPTSVPAARKRPTPEQPPQQSLQRMDHVDAVVNTQLVTEHHNRAALANTDAVVHSRAAVVEPTGKSPARTKEALRTEDILRTQQAMPHLETTRRAEPASATFVARRKEAPTSFDIGFVAESPASIMSPMLESEEQIDLDILAVDEIGEGLPQQEEVRPLAAFINTLRAFVELERRSTHLEPTEGTLELNQDAAEQTVLRAPVIAITVVEKLANLSPEKESQVEDIITEIVDLSQNLQVSDNAKTESESAAIAEAEARLEELCEELLNALEIDHNEEDIKQFLKILRDPLAIANPAEPAVDVDLEHTGTHEAKVNLTLLASSITDTELYLAHLIGKLTLLAHQLGINFAVNQFS